MYMKITINDRVHSKYGGGSGKIRREFWLIKRFIKNGMVISNRLGNATKPDDIVKIELFSKTKITPRAPKDKIMFKIKRIEKRSIPNSNQISYVYTELME